jgi:hypothetical protein
MKHRSSIVLAATALSLAGCSGDMCGNDIVSAMTSPDGVWDAVLFERNCGATTGLTTQISVLPHGEKLSGKGNVFIADADHGRAAAGPWGGPWAEMRWLAADHLQVTHARNARVFARLERKAHVRISYATQRAGR